MSRIAQVVCATTAVCLVLVSAGLMTVMSERIPDVGFLTRDPTVVAGVAWWTGALSVLTNLCWAVAGTVNLMAARVSPPPLQRSLLCLGALCIALGVDDSLRIHETVMPGLGVRENVVLASYGVVGLMLARYFWSQRATGVGAAFFTGAAMLGISVSIDLVSKTLFLPEDGAKLLGVLAWGFCGVWAHSDSLERLT